jgi:soluble lytic murein transglycosylase-like protein
MCLLKNMFRLLALAAVLLPGVASAHNVACSFSSSPETVAVDRALNGTFEGAGKQFRVDPDLGRAITAVESGFDAKAVSSKGAKGLMQLMPGTAETLHVTDPFNKKQSIYGGMEFLARIASMPEFSGKPYMVLVAYNAGPYRKTFPSESYQYADRVAEVYWKLKSQHHLDHHHLIAPTRGQLSYLSLPRCGSKTEAGPQRVRLVGGVIQPSRRY